ncbi:MAG: hypothetical protein IPK33_05900 [Gemmatimonadetes bacterium]|nr:hypothetical protein [Gemmatimonadota bacterium]
MSGAALCAWAYPEWLPVLLRRSFVANRDVIVSLFLRGGADGLRYAAPLRRPLYYTGRLTIAIPRPDSTAATKGIAPDSFFSFPQAMRFLVPAHQAGDLWSCTAQGSRTTRVRTSTPSTPWKWARRTTRASTPGG